MTDDLIKVLLDVVRRNIRQAREPQYGKIEIPEDVVMERSNNLVQALMGVLDVCGSCHKMCDANKAEYRYGTPICAACARL